jgi:hypothetical protein
MATSKASRHVLDAGTGPNQVLLLDGSGKVTNAVLNLGNGADLIPVHDVNGRIQLGNLGIGKAPSVTHSLDVVGTINSVNGIVGSNAVGQRTISTSPPSGGSNGDIWYQVV